MNLVLFDFDDTLTKFDTTLPFGVTFVGRPKICRRLLLLVFALVMVKFRIISNSRLKRAFAALFLRGRTRNDVRELAANFYRTRLNSLADEELLGLLRMHVAQGDCVYLLSANFDCLLEPLVAHWSLAGVIATQAGLQGEVYTGGIIGEACHGEEKLQRVITRFGRTDVEQSIAYGNRDDAPLLQFVRKGYLVRRAKPPSLYGRLRRWPRILAWKLSTEDLGNVSVMELFPSSGCPERMTRG